MKFWARWNIIRTRWDGVSGHKSVLHLCTVLFFAPPTHPWAGVRKGYPDQICFPYFLPRAYFVKNDIFLLKNAIFRYLRGEAKRPTPGHFFARGAKNWTVYYMIEMFNMKKGFQECWNKVPGPDILVWINLFLRKLHPFIIFSRIKLTFKIITYLKCLLKS